MSGLHSDITVVWTDLFCKICFKYHISFEDHKLLKSIQLGVVILVVLYTKKLKVKR